MPETTPTYTTVDEWIAREAIALSVDSPDEEFGAAVDRMIAALPESVELLGLGEALHGGEEILILRNRLFARLVESHGYTAIAVESSCSRAGIVNGYVEQAPDAAASYSEVQETGFSHGFGRLDANRELVEWMRQYNGRAEANGSHPVEAKLRFYGFDGPMEMMGTDSPRQLLHLVLDYIESADGPGAEERRKRIDSLLGDDAAWQNPAAMMDPTQSIGLSPAATALRIEVEDLGTELRLRRPELVARSDAGRWLEAAQHASVARQLLNYHAVLAGSSDNRIARLLGIRDVIMAENLAYALSRERGIARARGQGKVLAFAHNTHLKRGQARWQLGPHALAWWPAGSHLAGMLGSRYAVIGSGMGVSSENGIARPEAGTLEARLTDGGTAELPVKAGRTGARFIATRQGRPIRGSAVEVLPTRSGSTKNSTYFPLTPQSLTDFDALIVLDSTTYTRGGPPLP